MPPAYGSCEIKNLESPILEKKSFKLFEPIRKKIYCFPKRYTFSVICFTACCLAISFNMNLSIAIVSMVKKTNTTAIASLNSTYIQKISKVPSDRLSWSSKIVGLALGAVYYGQLVSFIPGGRMAELYGGKNMLIGCTLLASMATLLSPAAAFCNPYLFIATRILVGIGTGPIIPIVFYMLAKWMPYQERNFHASFIISGYGIGSFLAVLLSGSICGTTILGGWPAVYYIGAISGVIFSFVCSYMMSESPELHPSINENELLYIQQNLGSHKAEKITKIPWKSMVLSLPFWALAIGFFGQFWLLGIFSTIHSLYMGTVLNLPVAKNGLLSCLPHLLRAFATVAASYPVDILLKRNLVSVGFVRKGATIINSVISCGAFIGITYVGRSVISTTVLFMIAGVFGEFVTFGVCMACIDIAPNLSGTVSGLLNIVGVFPFFIIPSVVGWLTNYENSIEKWQCVFYVTVIIVCVCTVMFTLFGDLRPQPWGIIVNKESKSEESSETSCKSTENESLMMTIAKDKRLNS